MNLICKLNREIYRVVTEDIACDEVIITEKQIEHIKERHPDDYELFAKYFEEIINTPDYVLEGNTPQTVLLLKKIEAEGRPFKLVLRFKHKKEPAEYKNSIITFTRTDFKEFARIVKKKKIIYDSLRWKNSSDPHADGNDKAQA